MLHIFSYWFNDFFNYGIFRKILTPSCQPKALTAQEIFSTCLVPQSWASPGLNLCSDFHKMTCDWIEWKENEKKENIKKGWIGEWVYSPAFYSFTYILGQYIVHQDKEYKVNSIEKGVGNWLTFASSVAHLHWDYGRGCSRLELHGLSLEALQICNHLS